jgi:cysteine desulfurase
MVYLDHNATTPPDPAVVEAVIACMQANWGNPSSLHAAGQAARTLLERARNQVAALIGARPEEIVFSSGGTEANNQVLLSGLLHAPTRRRHLIVSAIEHQAVLEPARALEANGWEVTRIPVDRHGVVVPAAVAAALTPDTALVSVMLANNETGVLQPVAEIAHRAHAQGVPVHTDAVQAVGRIPVNVRELDVDYLTLAAHKFHGPKGAGALFVRSGAKLAPYLLGGQQEKGRRAGTENLPANVGLGVASELAAARLPADRTRIATLRLQLERELRQACPDLIINGETALRLPNTLSVSFPGVEAVALVMNLDLLGICASTGSACTASHREPPYVLVAMGLSPELALGTLRLSLGRGNTDDDIAQIVRILPGLVRRLRKTN